MFRIEDSQVLLRDGLYRAGRGERGYGGAEGVAKVGDIEEMGWQEKCWPLNHNVNLQHSESLSVA
jgi:hypothetical protein